MDLDLAGFLQMRVGEHVLHTWDITVALDPSSTIPADHAARTLANLPMVAGWTGQKNDEQVSVEVRTTDPERAFHLDLGPGGVSLAPSSDDTGGVSRAGAADRGVRPAGLRAARRRPHARDGRASRVSISTCCAGTFPGHLRAGRR